MIDLRPGLPWVGALDTPAWRRAWRLASGVTPRWRQDPHGLPGLRAALAEHVRRNRGVSCQDVLVTRGATNGLDLLAATVLRPGDRVGVEEPGYRRARAVLAGRGAELVPCPVDEHGLIVDALPDGLRLVYTTPSHQFPMGGVLPVPRRRALLAWARRTGALIAEDDYDGEFRYDVAPLPALYGLDPDVVVYLGTTAKILSVDMGVGWLVGRPDLVAAVARRRAELNDRTPVVPQEALRLLLEGGDVDRHVRRMSREYARRRAVVEALAGLRLHGDTAGLHLVADVPGDPEDVARRAAARGVLTETLAPHFAGPPAASGLVIGYGTAAGPAELRAGCGVLRALAGRGLGAGADGFGAGADRDGVTGRRTCRAGERRAGQQGRFGQRRARRGMGATGVSGPVMRRMSMPPGSGRSASGACEAPKCPPRAQSRRLRSEWYDCGDGSGGPAGQRRAMCQASSQRMIVSIPVSSEPVNGTRACPTTMICRQVRPSRHTGASSSRAARVAGSSCAISPVPGCQTRCGGRSCLTRSAARERAETERGSCSPVNQTTRGAPPCIPPPSSRTGMRAAPGSHASATVRPPNRAGVGPEWSSPILLAQRDRYVQLAATGRCRRPRRSSRGAHFATVVVARAAPASRTLRRAADRRLGIS
ncbi:hypothetical protein BJF79_33515 [Actinomadura sp. CNU-125]|nr:hypothetical protein BJF79_33515 [Actinomadura sp. CNU-125]